MTAPITESISLLARVNPGLLQRLRKEYPEAAALLAEGEEAGPEENRTVANDRVRATVALDSIKGALKEYGEWFPRLRRRLSNAQRAGLVAQILTVVAGASIFTSFAVEFPTAIKVVCGLLALLGSVVSLWSGYLVKPLGQDGSNLFDVYKRLAEAGARAELLDRQLTAWTNGIAPDQVIADANETCQIINQLKPLFIDGQW